MTRMKTLHGRRKRRSRKASIRGGRPNRGSKHKGKSGRTGGMHSKKTPSKKRVEYIVFVPKSMIHLIHFTVVRNQP